ncbi:MAG: tetratricopeptide repeat protein [Candidatus Melainabacteria bacterium]|nr:tetratricopeptide repeat protein [Candidatus Melainabacteria bacterium]
MSRLHQNSIHLLLRLFCASSLTLGLGFSALAQEKPSAKTQESLQNKAQDLRLLKEQSSLENYLELFKMGMTHTDLRGAGDHIVKLRRQITDSPNAPDLRIKLGSYLFLSGDLEGASMELRRALALDNENIVTNVLLGKISDGIGDHSAAQMQYRKAISLSPKLAAPFVCLADSFMAQGAISEAINEFRRANEVKATCQGLTGLAQALVATDDPEGSVRAARQAVSIMPSSSNAHVALTHGLLRLKEDVSALRTARQAVLLEPTSAESHIALGRALYANKKNADAVVEFEQAVLLDPLNAQARNDLGYALYKRGDVASAVTQLQLALRLNPRLSEARNNLELAIFGLSTPR